MQMWVILEALKSQIFQFWVILTEGLLLKPIVERGSISEFDSHMIQNGKLIARASLGEVANFPL